ncbi:glycosyltransferase family 2 protein [Pontibacter sp. BT731]|uniref:glycosyltransferase family 2 protein n=1 Tax=Pontibacter coccineus TaxID=3063328 RepID=UPI0026E1DEB3|nr:glycosyltransferase family 2 protein [Pontibacter sp. BT731]MDO6391150.1 glycosyltransferase family 2 protein [Pontibacter sp. BT731]
MEVSIVMPAYNAANTIAESIESVLKQTYKNWELIIVNDCSTDQTASIAKNYCANNSKIRLLTHDVNKGLSASRNTAISHAQGKWICFLDSDDVWHHEKLELQCEFHMQNETFLISHTNLEYFCADRVIKRPWKSFTEITYPKTGHLLPTLYYKNPIGVLTVMVEKDLLLKVGGFDISLPTLEDNDLWIRIAEKGTRFGYLSKVLAYYRISNGSLSNSINKYKKAYKIFIAKYADKVTDQQGLFDKIWGNYYRHFGTMYFKNKKYRLANLYFCKAISHHGISYVSLTTLFYIILTTTKLKLRKVV